MARRLLRPCGKMVCNNLTKNTYCDEHSNDIKREYDKRRPSAHKRGYDFKWNKYRASFLSKLENMFCISCRDNARITVATVVDHIIPNKDDKKLFWDTKNHQPICDRCHNSITAREDGGFGNK